MNQSRPRFGKEILDSPVFVKLSPEQRRNLEAKFAYVLELSEKLANLRAPLNLYELADIELDAWINIGAPAEDADSEVSSWLIQTSWVAECETVPLSGLLAPELERRVTRRDPEDSRRKLAAWLPEQARFLRLAALGALGATDICSLAAHVMAINVVLTELIATIARARLSSDFS